MGNTEVGGALRAIIGVGVGYAAGKGLIASGAAADVTAALATIALAIWSAWVKRKQA